MLQRLSSCSSTRSILRCLSTTAPTDVRLTALDALLGYQKTIEATWCYPGHLDIMALQASLDTLLKVEPLIGGRILRSSQSTSPFDGFYLNGSSSTSVVVHARSEQGTSRDIAMISDLGGRFHRRPPEPEAVMGGRVPVISVCATNFDGGGSALAVAMSHGIVDASGFYRTVARWSRLHEGRERDVSCPLLSRECILKLLSDRQVRARGGEAETAPAALDLSSWRGALLWRLVRLFGRQQLSERPLRALISFTADEVEMIRAACSSAGEAKPPTANEALSATLSRGIGRLLGLDGSWRLQSVVDMRRHALLPPGFLGNAFHVLQTEQSQLTEQSLADACATFRCLGQSARRDPAHVTDTWLERLALLEEGRLTGEATGSQTITTNFQCRLPSLDASFGAGAPLRVVPGVGDTIQMVAAPAGGIDVFLNLAGLPAPADWIRTVQSDAFRGELRVTT